jgi:hypothetical protein
MQHRTSYGSVTTSAFRILQYSHVPSRLPIRFSASGLIRAEIPRKISDDDFGSDFLGASFASLRRDNAEAL